MLLLLLGIFGRFHGVFCDKSSRDHHSIWYRGALILHRAQTRPAILESDSWWSCDRSVTVVVWRLLTHLAVMIDDLAGSPSPSLSLSQSWQAREAVDLFSCPERNWIASLTPRFIFFPHHIIVLSRPNEFQMMRQFFLSLVSSRFFFYLSHFLVFVSSYSPSSFGSHFPACSSVVFNCQNNFLLHFGAVCGSLPLSHPLCVCVSIVFGARKCASI